MRSKLVLTGGLVAAAFIAAACSTTSCVGLGPSSAAGQPGTTAFIVNYFRASNAPDPLGALLSDRAQTHAGSVDACAFPTP